MTKNALNPKFLASVRKLSDAFVEVSANWDDNYIDLVIPQAYPFPNDFNEVVMEIIRWKDAIEEANLGEDINLEIGAAKYEYGVWTPWAEVICFDCHNEIHPTAFEKGIAKVLEDQYATTTCDKCGKIIQMMDDIANEHNLVLALKKVGVNAEMAQTGGMCNALYVKLTDGNQYMLKYDEDGSTDRFYISEWDNAGEWLDKSEVEGLNFDTIQEAVYFLFTSSKVSQESISEWNKMFTPNEVKAMIKDRLKTGTLNGFESKETGQWIENPLYDETMRFSVDPIEHYGEESITLALIPWSPEEDDAPTERHAYHESDDLDAQVVNLKAIKDAFKQHVERFLEDQAVTGDYSERFDLKITMGNKTFNLPLGADLAENFEKMIQAEIDDLSEVTSIND